MTADDSIGPERSPAGSVTLGLSLSADQMLKLYEGSARDVVALDDDGQTVRFPAAILRPYVTHSGVQGRFRIRFDAAGRFAGIERL